MYQSILKSISAFPALSPMIKNVYQNPDISIAELAKIVEQDPGMVIDILRTANSPIYGFSREITNVRQAVALFGVATVKGFVISNMIRKSIALNLQVYNINVNNYLDTCREHNKLLMSLFKHEDSEIKEVIFPASFLMSAGILILANEAIKRDDCASFTNALKENPNQYMEIEKHFFGIDSVAITALLFEFWNFEPRLISALKNINDKNPQFARYSNPLNLALLLANFYQKYTLEQIVDAKQFISDNNLNLDSVLFDELITRESGFFNA